MRIYVTIILGYLISGCHYKPVSGSVKQNFTNRFEGQNTGLGEKLNIKGFYQYWLKNELKFNVKLNRYDTFFINILFYEDGTFLHNFFSRNIEIKEINDYLKEVSKNGKNDDFYVGFYWGIYSLSDDTIKAQYVNKPTALSAWDAREDWYLIKDKKTLQLIYSGMLEKMTDTEIDNYRKNVASSSNISFHPVDTIPFPYSWMKKEKWFWRSQKDWEIYLKSIGQ